MTLEMKYTVTKLNRSNYFNWSYKMKMLLVEKDLWISNATPEPITDEWTKNDLKAHSIIALNIQDEQIQYIRNCSLAKDAWNKLKSIHEKDTPNHRVYIIRQLMTQKLEEGGDVETHVNKMNELFQKLLALGDKITTDFILSATLLGSLPESYDGLVTALEAREEELGSDLVCAKVIAEFKKRCERKQEGNGEGVFGVKGATITCYFCKEKGHFKKDCSKYN